MKLIKNLIRVAKTCKLRYVKRSRHNTGCLKNFVNCYPNAKLDKNILDRILRENLREKCKIQFYSNLIQNTGYGNKQEKRSNYEKQRKIQFYGIVLTAILGYYYIVLNEKRKIAYAEPLQPDGSQVRCGEYNSDLPTYSMEEVGKHATEKDKIWCTYKEGVYDITDYAKSHPGAHLILAAAGDHLEPFFNFHRFHCDNDVVSTVLEKHRIGNLQKEDQIKMEDLEDVYHYQPKRHPDLLPLYPKPFNGEASGKRVVESFITPNDLFYVRSHLNVPECDPKTYSLEVEVEGRNKSITLSLDEIKDMPKVTKTVTLMCSGLRRSEVPNFRSITNWGIGGISNAKWTGVRLCDVLAKVGITEEEKELKHVQFEGLDSDHADTPYGVSIPIWKAVDKHGDVILAYEMNGVPLPPDHGFPLRVIIPGVAGARHAKWLARIIVSETESNGHYQQFDYKGFNPSTNWDNVDFSKSPAIIDVPVTSAICNPLKDETVRVEGGYITVKGWAYSGGGQKIIRVDVTSDGGDTWHIANLDEQDRALPPHHWAWTLWSIKLPVPEGATEGEIWCKATDSCYNTQPEDWKSMRNFRAVLNNPFHKVKIKLSKGGGGSTSSGGGSIFSGGGGGRKTGTCKKTC